MSSTRKGDISTDQITIEYQGNLIPLLPDPQNIVLDYLGVRDLLKLYKLDSALSSQYPLMNRFIQQRNDHRYDEEIRKRYIEQLNDTKANIQSEIKKIEDRLQKNRAKLELRNQECCCGVSQSCCACTAGGCLCGAVILTGFFTVLSFLGASSSCCSTSGCCAGIHTYLCSVVKVDASGQAWYCLSAECGRLSWITTAAVEGVGCIGGALGSIINKCCLKYNIASDEKALKAVNNEAFGDLNRSLYQTPTLVALSRINNSVEAKLAPLKKDSLTTTETPLLAQAPVASSRINNSVEAKHASLKKDSLTTTKTPLLAQAPVAQSSYGSSGFFQPVITDERTTNSSTSSNNSNNSNDTASKSTYF